MKEVSTVKTDCVIATLVFVRAVLSDNGETTAIWRVTLVKMDFAIRQVAFVISRASMVSLDNNVATNARTGAISVTDKMVRVQNVMPEHTDLFVNWIAIIVVLLKITNCFAIK